MAKGDHISADVLRQLVDYDADTGVFRWKERTPDMFQDGIKTAAHNCAIWNSKHSGSEAGSPCKGYVGIKLFRRPYYAHRLAWLYVTGEWPAGEIDHANGIKSDNRFSNLREATRSQNMGNIRTPAHNTTGVKGVNWHRKNSKWTASIQCAGKSKYLGSFDTKAEAAAAYEQAANDIFGEFKRVS
jgi:hypothetical protein